MAKHDNNLWTMGEDEVLDQARAILEQQSSSQKSWNLSEHVALIANIAVEHGLPSTMKEKFRAALGEHGVGGNASQFRQWLERKGVDVGPKVKGYK